MSQVTDYIITPTTITMSTLATELQEMFAAAASANRGATAPSNPFEGMFWWDSSANPEILKRYTVAAGWITLLSVNITTGAMAISGYVLSSLFDANTILAATTDDTPAALTIPEQTIVGRKTGGNIAALTGAEVATIIGVTSVLPWALVTDVKSAGVAGGAVSVAKQWNPRTLNTITGSEGDGDQTWVTLASDILQFSVGTYFIEASAPAFGVYKHKLALYNIDTSTYELIGTSEYSASGASTRSIIKGLLTVTNASHTYKLVHYTSSTQAANGLGEETDGGQNEVYAMIHITQHS